MSHFHTKKDQIYQDRLGTNIGKTIEKRVALSADYRINQTEAKVDPEESQLWAAYDAKAAVRWLRTNADKYRIDIDRVGAFGSSAGAMTVAFMSTVPGVGDNDDHSGVSSDIRVGVSLSGALECIGPNAAYCDHVVPNITASLPPFLDFHGCNDGTGKMYKKTVFFHLAHK